MQTLQGLCPSSQHLTPLTWSSRDPSLLLYSESGCKNQTTLIKLKFIVFLLHYLQENQELFLDLKNSSLLVLAIQFVTDFQRLTLARFLATFNHKSNSQFHQYAQLEG